MRSGNDNSDLVTISLVTVALSLFFGYKYGLFVGLVHFIGLPWTLWDLGLVGRRRRS